MVQLMVTVKWPAIGTRSSETDTNFLIYVFFPSIELFSLTPLLLSLTLFLFLPTILFLLSNSLHHLLLVIPHYFVPLLILKSTGPCMYSRALASSSHNLIITLLSYLRTTGCRISRKPGESQTWFRHWPKAPISLLSCA